MAYTPFQLVRNVYDVINLKKIYNTFPTSLRVTQLTSNQLLDFLQGRVDEQNEEIQRLLALLRESSNQTLDLSSIQDLLNGLEGTIGGEIADLLAGAGTSAEDAGLQAQIEAKLSQGYRRFGNSLLFMKVNTIPVAQDRSEFSGYDFGGNQFDVNDDTIRGDHVNPITISLSNLSNIDITVQKIEQYEGMYVRGQLIFPPGAIVGSNYAPGEIINVFNTQEFNFDGSGYKYTVSANTDLVDLSVDVIPTFNKGARFISSEYGIGQGDDWYHLGKVIFKNLSDGSQLSYRMRLNRDTD